MPFSSGNQVSSAAAKMKPKAVSFSLTSNTTATTSSSGSSNPLQQTDEAAGQTTKLHVPMTPSDKLNTPRTVTLQTAFVFPTSDEPDLSGKINFI